MNNFEFRKNNFDLIRLLAALQVVAGHGLQHFKVDNVGWLLKLLSFFPGVPIFFVLSGFLISASFERSSSLASYFENRMLRIYPALWMCFILSTVTIFTLSAWPLSGVEFGQWALAQLTIGQVYNPDALRAYGVGVPNGSLWTIPVEIQFYIAIPFIYLALNHLKWNKLALSILVIASVAANQLYFAFSSGQDSLAYKILGVTAAPYLYMFLFGVVLQRNKQFIAKYLANNALTLFVLYASAVSIYTMLGFSSTGTSLNPVIALFLALLTISMAYSNVEKFGNVLKGNDISYGVYIYHMIVVNALVQMALFSPTTNMAIMMTLTVAIALLSWRLIEKPSLSLKRTSVKRTAPAKDVWVPNYDLLSKSDTDIHGGVGKIKSRKETNTTE